MFLTVPQTRTQLCKAVTLWLKINNKIKWIKKKSLTRFGTSHPGWVIPVTARSPGFSVWGASFSGLHVETLTKASL